MQFYETYGKELSFSYVAHLRHRKLEKASQIFLDCRQDMQPQPRKRRPPQVHAVIKLHYIFSFLSDVCYNWINIGSHTDALLM